MASDLCFDILQILYDYNKIDFAKTCKTFRNFYKKDQASATQILKWYRKYWFNSKLRLINMYNRSYEWKYLKNYPTFLVKKCNKLHLLNTALLAESTESKSCIIKFLMHPNITKNDIEYTGW